MMATIKEIIAMCKAGDVGEAYEIAKRDFMEWPQNIWVQRGLGWVLFYKIKNCAELRKKEELYNHFRELSELDLLTPQTDAYIFDNVFTYFFFFYLNYFFFMLSLYKVIL